LTAEPPQGTPPADFPIDGALVRRLIDAQLPQYSQLPLHHLDSGFDNEMYRLGQDLLVRLPRREVAQVLIRNEQRWLPELAPHLPLQIPAPLAVGEPMFGYPWSFSVLPWIAGESADLAYPEKDQAVVLARFFKALHSIAQPDCNRAPDNPYRGGPLRERVELMDRRLAKLAELDHVMSGEFLTRWQAAVAAPAAQRSVWLHGDAHARNLVVENGKLAAVIDWGDITAGDAATDLACLWMLFADEGARAEALVEYGANEALALRAQGWALWFAVLLLESGLVDHPRHAAMGRVILANVLGSGVDNPA